MWSLVDQAILPLSDPESPVAMLSPGTPPPHPPLSSCDGRLPLIVVVVWWARPDASPPGSDITPFLAIANARASGLIALAAAGQAPGARPVAILLHLGNCEMKYPRSRGRRQRRGWSLRLPNTAFRAAQTRKRGKEEKKMPHPAIASLCWARPLPRVAIGFPRPGLWTGHHTVGLFWVWWPSPLARMPSLSRPIIMQHTHPRAVLQSRAGPVPLHHGSAGSASSLPREFVLLFRIIHPVGCSRIPSVYMDSSLLSPATEAPLSLVTSFEKFQVRPTGRKRSRYTLHEHRQASRSRPGEVPRQRASACSAKISAPLVIYETTLGGFHSHTPKPRALYPGRYRACRLYVCSFLSPFQALPRSLPTPTLVHRPKSPFTRLVSSHDCHQW